MTAEAGASREGRLEMWKEEWSQGHWDIIYKEPGMILSRHFERLTEGRPGLKILVPMSATTYDLIWLHNKGHTVVGTDLAEAAAQRIYKQMKLEPIIEDVPSINGKLYKNASGTLKYYVGDFFKFNEDHEGKFDFILDSKAMCSCDERDWNCYLKVIRSVMGPKCLLMMEFFRKSETDESQFPYCFTKEKLQEFYGDLCDIEYLDEGLFDMDKFVLGDIDAEGNIIPSQKAFREGGDSDFQRVIPLDAYCLRKREQTIDNGH